MVPADSTSGAVRGLSGAIRRLSGAGAGVSGRAARSIAPGKIRFLVSKIGPGQATRRSAPPARPFPSPRQAGGEYLGGGGGIGGGSSAGRRRTSAQSSFPVSCIITKSVRIAPTVMASPVNPFQKKVNEKRTR